MSIGWIAAATLSGCLILLVIYGAILASIEQRQQRREVIARARASKQYSDKVKFAPLRADVDDTEVLRRLKVVPTQREWMKLESLPAPAAIVPTRVEKKNGVVIYCDDCDTDNHKCLGCGMPTAHGLNNCGDC